jgi:hypothetical protein
MPTDHEILFIVGGCTFAVLAIGAAVLSGAAVLWKKQFSTFILTTIQCSIMALVYALLAFDWWAKQRKDGREFPWYRDVAQVGVMFLHSWMVCVLLWLENVDAFVVLGVTFIGSVALAISNFMIADEYWYGWAAAGGVYILCNLFIIQAANRKTWHAYVVLATSMILVIGLPLVQMLSWTMSEALDKSPHNFDSEIAYLVVTVVGIAVTGVAAGVLQAAPHTAIQHIAVPKAAEAEAEAEPEEQVAATPQPSAGRIDRAAPSSARGVTLRRNILTATGVRLVASNE